ncbi:17217_t:CDS:2, partial [Gigaspora rosea]
VAVQYFNPVILILKIEGENNSELVEDQPVNSSLSDQNSAEAIEASVVGQQFHDWNELDRFISFYAKSQNFVSVIRGSEYDKGVCRIRRYACEHQGSNSTKGKTNIVENQRQTRSKRTGYNWHIRASCPKTIGILSISSLCLNHNDHPINNQTNKFALKYRVFTEEMLKDIRFWTEI